LPPRGRRSLAIRASGDNDPLPPATSRPSSSLEDAVRAASAAAEAGHALVEEEAPTSVASKARAVAAKAEGAAAGWFGGGRKGAAPARQTRGVSGRPPPRGSPATRRARGAAKLVLYAAAAYALVCLGAAVMRVARARGSAPAVRARTVDKNRLVVDTIAAALGGVGGGAPALDTAPGSAAGLADGGGLTPALVRRLVARTGFTPPEVFRKWLWYALRERRFDGGTVSDLVALKAAAALTDADVAAALAERAARIYARYGTVMLETAGMTAAGIERKAAARALFSKVLYLAECEEVLGQASGAAAGLDIPAVFGATEEDAARLRLVSLVEVDLDKLEFGGGGDGDGAGGWGGLAA